VQSSQATVLSRLMSAHAKPRGRWATILYRRMASSQPVAEGGYRSNVLKAVSLWSVGRPSPLKTLGQALTRPAMPRRF
jgi:hypothetical protein